MGKQIAYFSVKNFDRYQHYKHRNPPWLKLYYSLLDDHEFISLSPEHRGYLMMLFLVAGTQNNLIRNDPQYLMKVMRLSNEPDLTPLFQSGFLLASRKHLASTTLAPCKQNAMSEKSRVEKSREEAHSLTDEAWMLSLATDPAYLGLNVPEQAAKCRRWCETNKKSFSRRRLVNWLNRADKPLSTTPTLPTRTSRNLAALSDHAELEAVPAKAASLP